MQRSDVAAARLLSSPSRRRCGWLQLQQAQIASTLQLAPLLAHSQNDTRFPYALKVHRRT